MNEKMIQIKGPFTAREEIVNRIDSSNFQYIKEIGISTKTRHYVLLNNEIFEIGKTGMLQFQDTHITSIQFLQDEDEKTLIDCILE